MTLDQIRDVAIDVLIPVAAILIPTLISIGLYRAERREAANDRARERRLEAGAEIARALAPLGTIDGTSEDMRPLLADLRGRITIYRAWTTTDDIVGDWLALRYKEGMRTWTSTLAAFDPNGMSYEQVLQAQRPAHDWSASTAEMFTGWLAGHVTTEQIRTDGARILKKYPEFVDEMQS